MLGAVFVAITSLASDGDVAREDAQRAPDSALPPAVQQIDPEPVTDPVLDPQVDLADQSQPLTVLISSPAGGTADIGLTLGDAGDSHHYRLGPQELPLAYTVAALEPGQTVTIDVFRIQTSGADAVDPAAFECRIGQDGVLLDYSLGREHITCEVQAWDTQPDPSP